MEDIRALLEIVQQTQQEIKENQSTILERLDALEASQDATNEEQLQMVGKIDKVGYAVGQLYQKVSPSTKATR